MIARGRILPIWFRVTLSLFIGVSILTRLVDSHIMRLLKKATMRRGVTLVLPYVDRRRHVSRTLLPTTSAHFPAGSIKATRGVTTLQTFEIRAARKMWPSVVVDISCHRVCLYFHIRHLNDICSESEVISGHDINFRDTHFIRRLWHLWSSDTRVCYKDIVM